MLENENDIDDDDDDIINPFNNVSEPDADTDIELDDQEEDTEDIFLEQHQPSTYASRVYRLVYYIYQTLNYDLNFKNELVR